MRLIALFEKVQSILPSLDESKSVAQSWRNYLVDLPNRRKLYTDVVTSYRSIFEEFEKDVMREQDESVSHTISQLVIALFRTEIFAAARNIGDGNCAYGSKPRCHETYENGCKRISDQNRHFQFVFPHAYHFVLRRIPFAPSSTGKGLEWGDTICRPLLGA